MNNSEKLIKKLQMIPHPEGGHFKESYRDKNISLIYYLLKKNEKSHWHRLTKNEILHFYDGDPLIVFLSKNGIDMHKIILIMGRINYLIWLLIAGLGLVWKQRGNIL